MEGFSLNFNGLWQNLINYFVDIYHNPLKLVVMILDLIMQEEVHNEY